MDSPLKYHGGKHYLAQWTISHFPPRDGDRPWNRFCDVCCGSCAIPLAMDPEGISEIVNDVDLAVANFWAVLRHPAWSAEFIRRANLMPVSGTEFLFSKAMVNHSLRKEQDVDFIDGAVWFFVLCRQSRQALQKDYVTPTSRTRRGMNEHVSAWLSAVDGLPDVVERIRRWEVRGMTMTDFIALYDSEKTLFYIDPPYLQETRYAKKSYKYEITRDDHAELLKQLSGISGRFALAGYKSKLYDQAAEEFGWRVESFTTSKQSSSKKEKPKAVECLYLNY